MHYLGYSLAVWIDLLALIWFIVLFNGYMRIARYKSYKVACLASVMHLYRLEWIRSMLSREVRVSDTTTVANLERGVTFFASTTMLILAGLMTLLARSDTALMTLSELPFTAELEPIQWDMRILVLIVLFVYAFFKFTWSLRQYGFVSVMIGGAPLISPTEENQKLISVNANRIAKMASMAANNFNIGLRTYYFSIAVLGWLISPWIFMILTVVVVTILYRREFVSSTLNTLLVTMEIDQGRLNGG